MREATLFSLLKRKARKDGFTGVAITTDGISVAHVLRSKGQLPQLTRCAFRECSDASQQPAILSEMVKDQNLTGSEAVFVLQPGNYSVLQVEAPEVEPDELKAAIRWRIKDLIDFHIDDAVIDVFDIPERHRQGHARMMYVVAARAPYIQHYVDILNHTELELAAIDISELCYRNLAALYPEDVSGVVTLALSGDNGMVTLTRQSSLYLARQLDIGLNQLANSNASSEGELTLDATGVYDNAVLELQRSMDYYESYFSQSPISGIVITPLNEQLGDFANYLKDNLRVPTRNLDINETLACKQPISAELQRYCLPAITAALRTEQTVL